MVVMRRLHEILSDPALLAEVQRRACGDAGVPLGPPVQLPPVTSRWPETAPRPQQRTNVGPAAKARTERATTKEV